MSCCTHNVDMLLHILVLYNYVFICYEYVRMLQVDTYYAGYLNSEIKYYDYKSESA